MKTPASSCAHRAILLMIGASFSFACMALATKKIGSALSAAEVVFIRSLVGFLVILVLIYTSRTPKAGQDLKLLLARGIIGSAALLLYFSSLAHLHLGTAMLLNYTSPIFALILAALIQRDRISPAGWGLTLVSFLGVYLISIPKAQGAWLYYAMGLLSGFLAGSVHVLIRSSQKAESGLTVILYFMGCAVALSGLWLILSQSWVWPSGREWVWLSIVTSSSITGQLCLTYSLFRAPVALVAPFNYLTPVLGILMGMWFFKEPTTVYSLIGCFLVIGSGIVLYRIKLLDSNGHSH